MSHLSKISFSFFLHHFLKTSKCFILMQTPLQLDIWLQSYEGFGNAKNNIMQRNLNTVFANISKTTSPTSDSFLLIMSQLCAESQFTSHADVFKLTTSNYSWIQNQPQFYILRVIWEMRNIDISDHMIYDCNCLAIEMPLHSSKSNCTLQNQYYHTSFAQVEFSRSNNF